MKNHQSDILAIDKFATVYSLGDAKFIMKNHKNIFVFYSLIILIGFADVIPLLYLHNCQNY